MNRLIERLQLGDRLRKENISRYFLQCGLAAFVVLIVLLILDAVTQTVLIAALGASAFIAFAVPWSNLSGPRNMIGGYIVGMTCGCLLDMLSILLRFSDPIVAHSIMILFGALATGLAMFVMVVTRTEHPPAAALSLGLVLNEWDLLTLVVVISGIATLSIIKRLVLPFLMDLL